MRQKEQQQRVECAVNALSPVYSLCIHFYSCKILGQFINLIGGFKACSGKRGAGKCSSCCKWIWRRNERELQEKMEREREQEKGQKREEVRQQQKVPDHKRE